jgi:RNA polymerase sigma factor (sigma-70 family)
MKKNFAIMKQPANAQICFREFHRQNFKIFSDYARRKIKDHDHANSIVSDAFHELWRESADFEDEEGVKKQLTVRIKNKCVDFLRKKGKPELDITELTNLCSEVDERALEVSRVTMAALEQLNAVVAQLAPKQRYILVEHYLKSRSAKDISEEMGIRISSFHNNKARGLKAALKILKKGGLLFFCLLVALPLKENCNNWVKKYWRESSKISRVHAI